jgi:hypothetical protein
VIWELAHRRTPRRAVIALKLTILWESHENGRNDISPKFQRRRRRGGGAVRAHFEEVAICRFRFWIIGLD